MPADLRSNRRSERSSALGGRAHAFRVSQAHANAFSAFRLIRLITICRKVILGARPASPATPLVKDTSIGAFVLPNALIPDETPLQTFRVPGQPIPLCCKLKLIFRESTVEAVERAAGLTLFDELTKAKSKELCQTVQCEVIVRRFDDVQKKLGGGSRRGSFGTPKL